MVAVHDLAWKLTTSRPAIGPPQPCFTRPTLAQSKNVAAPEVLLVH
jgi:hypothetical protein